MERDRQLGRRQEATISLGAVSRFRPLPVRSACSSSGAVMHHSVIDRGLTEPPFQPIA